MARLQVLHLPSVIAADETVVPRFALILDQVDKRGPDGEAEVREFAHHIGAAGVYVTTDTVDVHQGDDGDLTDELAVFIREHVQARVDEAVVGDDTRAKLRNAGLLPVAKMPPVDTRDGRVARTWGGSRPDPREGLRGQAVDRG